MRRPWLVWVPVALTIAFLSFSTWRDNEGVADYGALVLNVLLLIITATTLQLTIPEPAKLWVHRQDELGHTDLIFYVVGDSPEGIPRDYLLQFHVAVSNVGGRRAVLSKLELKNLLDGSGEIVDMGLGRVSGSQYTTRQRWIDTMPVLQGQRPNPEHFAIRDDIRGPFSMQPDDVVSLRLRARSGID